MKDEKKKKEKLTSTFQFYLFLPPGSKDNFSD